MINRILSSPRSDKQEIKVRVSDQTLSLMFNRCIHIMSKSVAVSCRVTFTIEKTFLTLTYNLKIAKGLYIKLTLMYS